MATRYNKLSEFYKNKFGERVLKICVNGGFTCPNRDGKVGVGGCIFCSENGSGEHIKCRDVATQVRQHLDSYRGQRANKFIVYFQNFSNTYASIDKLKHIYDSALISDKIIGLSIATRPDCVNKEVVDLIKSYTNNYYVTVELGLQTADDNVAQNLNLNYSVNDFINAVNLLKSANVELVAHVMIGLPGENEQSIEKTIKLINDLDINGVKIHNTYVVKNTILEQMYKNDEYVPITLEQYLEKLAYVICRLKESIVIHRLSGDAHKEILVAPDWNGHKKWIINGIDKLLAERNLWQGKYKD